MMKKNIVSLFLFLLAFLSQAQNYVFQSEISNYTASPQLPSFGQPWGLVTNSSGNILVTDFNSSKVVIISSTGTLISEFGSNGTGDGQFTNPAGIALDASGNIYVADRGNNRIQKFSSTGVFIAKWGTSGTGNGQFNNPMGIAVEGTNVYVTEESGNRVQKFNTSGAYVTQWGSNGTGDGQFVGPSGVTTDAAGNVYVVDRGNHRIQKFTSTGVYSSKWGSFGAADGQFSYPRDIKIDASGNIYVSDNLNHRIQKFNSAGTFVIKWGTSGTANTQFYSPKGITLVSGNLVIVDSYYFRTFTTAGVYTSMFTADNNRDGQFQTCTKVQTDASGNVYVLDVGHDYLHKYNSAGVFQAKYGISSDAVDFAINSASKLYVVKQSDNTVSKSNIGGFPTVDIGTAGTGNGQFSQPVAVAVDASDNVYVADWGNRRIQKFSSNNNYATQWGSAGTGDGQFMTLKSVTTDASGNVYVAEQNRVQKFTNTGTFILKWGSAGSGNGQFGNIEDIVCDDAGNVYVVEASRIQKFSSTGVFITKWGSAGAAQGSFNTAKGIHVNTAGVVYVADAGNKRIQTFVTDREIKVSQGSTEIVSGTGVYDFGAFTLPANSGDITFTITNEGSLGLSFTGTPTKISLIGGNASDFSITQTALPSILAPGASVTFTVRFTPSAIGTRTTTLVIATNDADENPYTITLNGNGKTNQTITSGGNVNKTYGAIPFTPTSSSSSGLTVSYSSGNTAVATVSGTLITVVGAGTSVITVSQAGSTSYNAAADETFTLTVAKKDLTLKADNNYRYTGEANPAFTYVVSGFVNGDDPSDLTGLASLTCSANAGSPEGDYDIVISTGTLSSNNYNFIFQNGILSVSIPTGVVSAEYASLISVYPSPSDGQFSIDAPDVVEQVTVIDAVGRREVFYLQDNIQTTFKGLVVLEVKTNKGIAYIKALVK